MKKMAPTRQSSRPIRPGRRRTAPRERLAFTDALGTVPRSGTADASAARDDSTFATAPNVEPQRDWGHFGLFAFTAVLLLRPQDQIHALTALHPAEVCALVGIAPMLIHRFANRRPVFRVTPEAMALLAFGMVMLLTAPFSVWPGGALQEFINSYLKVVIVFVLMINTLTTPKEIERLTWLIVLCIGYIAAFAVFDYARGMHLVEDGRLGGPVGGIFGNPNDLALNMVTFIPMAAVIALSNRRPAWRRLLAAGIAVFMLATVVLTKSRGGVLGLMVMLATLVILGRHVRRGFAVVTIGAVVLATPFLPTSFWNRMASMTDSRVDQRDFTGSSEARRTVMLEGIAAFVEHPLTGVGAGQFKNYNPPGRKERWLETHNALIQVAAETGIGGLVLFSFLIFRAALSSMWTRRALMRPARRGAAPGIPGMDEDDRRALNELTVAMTAGLAGWFTCAFFASVAYSWTFYYVLALIVAAREIVMLRMSSRTATNTAHAAHSTAPAHGRAPGRLVPGVA